MKSGLVYIAAPYNGTEEEIENRMEIFYEVYAKLLSMGCHVMSPLMNHHILHRQNIPGDYEYWKAYSMKMMIVAEELIVIKTDGWEESTGVNDEIDMAEELGISIDYIDPDEFLGAK